MGAGGNECASVKICEFRTDIAMKLFHQFNQYSKYIFTFSVSKSNRRQAKDGMNREKELHFLIISFAYFKREPCDRCMPDIVRFPNDLLVLDECGDSSHMVTVSILLYESSKEHAMQPTKSRRTHLTWLGSTQLVVYGAQAVTIAGYVVLTHFT